MSIAVSVFHAVLRLDYVVLTLIRLYEIVIYEFDTFRVSHVIWRSLAST
jgi:hypothetical protein